MRNTLLIEDKGFLDFSPCDAGFENCEPKHKFGPHIRNYYLIHFVVSGCGSFKTPRGESKIGKGEAFLIKPGEVTVYEADGTDPWEYLWIGFNGKLAQHFDILPDVFEYDSSIISDIYSAASSNSGREELLAAALFKLSAFLFDDRKKEDYPGKVINYITAHYMENVTISSVADDLGLNRKYLARIFKEKNGISMQEFLINKRLHEAKKLLRAGYNVEECAYMVGYKDPFGFSKAFKKRYGVSAVSVKNEK